MTEILVPPAVIGEMLDGVSPRRVQHLPLIKLGHCPRLTITGTLTYPEKRAGDGYELTVCGGDVRSSDLNATVKDVQARDEYGSPQYREYRGRQIPVYNPPSGLGHLEKVRGEARWTGWLFVASRFVNDALVLLSHGKSLFLAIHECKDKRKRWIRALSLQTTNPEDE